MGVSVRFHFGSYIEVDIPFKTVTEDHCKKPISCENPQEGYCQQCGLDTKKRFSTKKVEDKWTKDIPTFWDLFDGDSFSPVKTVDNIYFCKETREYINKGNTHLLVPNCADRFHDLFDYHGIDQVHECPDLNPAYELEYFKAKNEAVLFKLKEFFGYDAVRVKYGVIKYFN